VVVPSSRDGRPGTRAVLSRRGFLVRAGWVVAGVPLLRYPLTQGGTPLRTPAPAECVEVHMRSDPDGSRVWFDPSGVLVRPGVMVRWTALEGVHTTTAYHPRNDRPLRLPVGADPWDSGFLVAGRGDASFEIRPSVKGVYDFFCRPHEAFGMVGRLVVWDGEGSLPAEPEYPYEAPSGALPAAARDAFPTVAAILRHGRIRGTV